MESSIHPFFDIRLKSPFTAMVVGGTGSGKTVLLMSMIRSAATIATQIPEEIIYCYGVWQKAYETLPVTDVKFRFHEGIINIHTDIPKDYKNRWLIIDDLMSEVAGKDETNDIFTKYSHHLNLSVFYVTQQLFNKKQRAMSLNTQYFFLFKDPRNGSFITHLAQQVSKKKVKAYEESYEDATVLEYSYLLVDMTQSSDNRVRVLGKYGTKNMTAYVF